MIANSAVQKLERYGNLGLKRSTLDQFVSFSIRDEKQSNVFALTHVPSWKECEAFFRASPTAFVSEMLLYAMSFAVALVSQNEVRIQVEDRLTLIRTWISILSLLRRQMISDSLETTRACAHLCGTVLDLVLLTSSKPAELTLTSTLIVAVLNKMSFFYAKRPQPSLLHVKLLANALKGRQQQHQIQKESLFQKIAHVASEVGYNFPAVFVSCCNLVKQLLANRPTRLLLYYRGDENKLLLSDVKDLADCNTALFAISGPNVENADVWATGSGKEEIIRWAHALPLIFSAFCVDSRWTVVATEQRRKVLEAERAQKDRQRTKTVQGKKMSRPHGSVEGSIFGDDDKELSILETIDTAVMSEMSAASAASFASFMSKVDPLQRNRGEILQHESSDGNSNLPLIFLEQILVTMHTIVPRLPTDAKVLCWRQTASMLNFVRASIVASDREGLPAEPLFDFARDVRYNRGLGYQSLGVVFAKVVVPYFEYSATTAVPGADRYVGECLAVFEAVAPQVIDENLSSVLSIVSEAACQDTCGALVSFLQGVVHRLAMTNQLDRLLHSLFSVFQSQHGSAAAKVFLRPTLGRSWIEQAVGFALDPEALLKDVAVRIGRIAEAPSDDFAPCLSLCSVVIDGIRATSLSASAVVEACAEMDLVLTSLISGLVDDRIESAILVESLLLLLSARRQTSLCLLDLGVDAVDDFIGTLESTLWECSTRGANFLNDVQLSTLTVLIGAKKSKFTKCTGERCVMLLAAQRLSLCKLVSLFLGQNIEEKKALRALAKQVVEHLVASGDEGCAAFSPHFNALCAFAPRAMIGAATSILRSSDLRSSVLNSPLLGEIVNEICTAACGGIEAITADSESADVFVATATSLSDLVRANGGIPHLGSVLSSFSSALLPVQEVSLETESVASAAGELLSDILGLAQTPSSLARPLFIALFSSKHSVKSLVRRSRGQPAIRRFLVSATSFLCRSVEPDYIASSLQLTLEAMLKELCDSPQNGLNLLYSVCKQHEIRPRLTGKAKRAREECLPGDNAADVIEMLWAEIFAFLVQSSLPAEAKSPDHTTVELVAECICLLFDHLSGSRLKIDFEVLKQMICTDHSALMSLKFGAGCMWRLVALPGASEAGLPALLCATFSDQGQLQNREVLSGMINAAPTILRFHATLPSAVQLVQRTLFAGVEAQHSDIELFRQVVRALPLISGVHDVRIATFKSIIKASLASACSGNRRPNQATLRVWTHVSQLLLIPSGALHRDRVVETIGLQFVLTVLERPVRCGVGWGDIPDMWTPIIRNILNACSSSFLVFGALLESHAMILPVFMTTLTEHVLEGLQAGVYIGAVASLLVSFFYRLIKTAASHPRVDELHWVICGALAHLFQSTSRFMTTFSRFSRELDSFATDIVKFLERGRLPANTPPIRVLAGQPATFAGTGDESEKGHGEHSYCDLSFVLIQSDDGKNLFRDAVLRAHDQEQRVIFNAA